MSGFLRDACRYYVGVMSGLSGTRRMAREPWRVWPGTRRDYGGFVADLVR